MDSGRILRDATPEETYRQPRFRFVADFLGQCNFLTGAVTAGPGGSSIVKTAEFADGITVLAVHASTSATIAIRPEDIEISQPGDAGSGTPGMIRDTSYLGDHYQYRIAVGSVELLARAQRPLAHGPVRVRIPTGVATFVE
jgi:iron(III) transport system ATP-binding protein